jgi:hypothetical protein
MAWITEIPIIVRYLINDLDSSNYKYADSRIQQTVAISAQFLKTEIDFSNDYQINIANSTITPDPTDANYRDNDFIVLAAMKAACIIIGSEIKLESGNAIAIKDGPSSIDLRGVTGTLSMLYKDICSKYEQAVIDYKAGNSIAGQAILGPYSPASDFVSRTHSDYDHRSNYFRY